MQTAWVGITNAKIIDYLIEYWGLFEEREFQYYVYLNFLSYKVFWDIKPKTVRWSSHILRHPYFHFHWLPIEDVSTVSSKWCTEEYDDAGYCSVNIQGDPVVNDELEVVIVPWPVELIVLSRCGCWHIFKI